jgi:hypothetical protein
MTRENSTVSFFARFVKSAFFLPIILVLASTSYCRAYAQTTVAANVSEALAQSGLNGSVEMVRVHRDFVIAKPRVLPDGEADHSLWNLIQWEITRAQGAGTKGRWLHDPPCLSRLLGNGIHSYRQRSRPSLQAVFYFPGSAGAPPFLDSQGEAPYFIKLDVDRFPPGGARLNSARHFLIEILPHWLLQGRTNQERIAAKLRQRRQANELKVHLESNGHDLR